MGWNEIAQDIRYNLRALRSTPRFVTTVVLSLALGIGANTAIFTVTSAVFRTALPVQDVSRLLEVYWVDRGTQRTGGSARLNVSYLNYRDLRDRNDVFASLACFQAWTLTMSDPVGGRPTHVQVTLASANYFEVLGVEPVLGRVFLPGEDTHPGGDRIAVISHRMWTTRFGADPAVNSQTVVLNDVPFTIVGVAPPGFKGTMTLLDPEQIWIPVSMLNEVASGAADTNLLNLRRNRQVRVFGRLKPAVEMAAALASVQAVARGLEREFPWENTGGTFDVAPLADAALDWMPTGNGERVMTALGWAAALILLIASLNVSNLLLIRGSARAREVAVRAAIGATRMRLVRQFLVEGLLLAGAGGVMGLLLGILGSRLLWSLRPEYISRGGLELQLDWRVLLFSAGVTLAASVVFAVSPAWYASVPNLSSLMNAGRRGSTSGGERHSLRNLLVVAQVAVASIALVFAGLLIRSLQHAEQVTLGFERHHIGVFDFDVGARRRSPEAKGQFLAAMLDTATTVPGVSSVALATSAPLSGSGSRTVLSEEQQGNPQVIGTTTALKYVTHDFFRTMGVSATEGRLFDRFDRDGAKRVAVVNEAMAQYFWPGRSPIGKRFLLRSIPGVYHEVVGVVPNSVLWELNEVPQPIGYIPLEQDPQTRLSLHVRAVGDPGPAVAAVMRHVQSLDPGLALTSLATIDSLLESRLWAWQAGASLFALFAGLCLLLASVGVSGALAHTVFLRTSEIGIRIALGSSLGHMQWSIVRDGVQLVIAGIAVGAAAAVALSAVIRSLLFGVAATDLTTYGAASGIVVIIGAGACWVAARRVLKIDPVRAIGGT